jgi:AcrR family transcriptional regulator
MQRRSVSPERSLAVERSKLPAGWEPMAVKPVVQEANEQGSSARSRRAEIARRATRLFAEKGYDATSIFEICEAAGIGRSLLYHYFRTKQEILRAIHENTLRPLMEQYRHIYQTAPDPASALRGFSRAYLTKMAENIDEAIVWGRERKALQADEPYWREVEQFGAEFRGMLESSIRRGIASGAFREIDVALALRTWANIHHHTYTWLNPEGRISIDEISDFFMSVFLDGVSASSEAAD